MKAVLVIDMPNRCSECPLCSDGQCDALGIYLEDVFNQKHECCPLRPIIDDIPEDESAVYVRGFLDGILNIVDDDEEGETDESNTNV